jgi:hypothetical protein
MGTTTGQAAGDAAAAYARLRGLGATLTATRPPRTAAAPAAPSRQFRSWPAAAILRASGVRPRALLRAVGLVVEGEEGVGELLGRFHCRVVPDAVERHGAHVAGDLT